MHSKIDPRLEKLQRYLKHLRYTGYDLLETELPLSARAKQTFSIAGDRKVSVGLPRKTPTTRVRVKIISRKGKLLVPRSRFRERYVRRGRSQVQGRILVLPLTAKLNRRVRDEGRRRAE